MKRSLKNASLILVVIMLITMQFNFVWAGEGAVVKQDNGQLIILHTNDVHSRVDDKLGYASVKGWKDYYEAQGARVMLLDAGDNLHGYPIANLGQGENIVDIMNAVGYTAMTPGNHDFNYGTGRLLELKKDMKFDLLSANFTDKDGREALTPSKLYNMDGVKVGVIGISTPDTETKTNPENVRGYSFNNNKISNMVQLQINKLEKEGADYIVALGHLGLDEESKPYCSDDIIEQTQGIDVFVDGHSHTALENGKVVKDKAGNDVMLAQTGNYIESIGKVTIENIKDKDNAKITASLIKEAKIDEPTKKLIDDKKAEIKPMLDTIVAKTEVMLDGERDPGVRTGETNLGDLAADAIRAVAGADVALTNGGGIRTSLKEGNITYGNLNSVFPFGNIVVSIDVKGKDILSALEHGTKSYPQASGGFPQVSGMSFEINTAVTTGRVQNVKVGNVPLDMNKTYKLATNDFTKVGGDGYTMFTGYKKTGEYGALDEALVNYIEKDLKGVVGKQYEKSQDRIIEVKDNSKNDGKLPISAGMTREQAANKILEYSKSIGEGPVGSWAIHLKYTDLDKVADSNLSGIMFCTIKGYMIGYTDGSFRPTKPLTEKEVEIIQDRFYSR